MACNTENLSILAYANGFTLWHYSSKEDKLDDIKKVNYFKHINVEKGLIKSGDAIIINVSDGNVLGFVTVINDTFTFKT